jgi:hypothetical protein
MLYSPDPVSITHGSGFVATGIAANVRNAGRTTDCHHAKAFDVDVAVRRFVEAEAPGAKCREQTGYSEKAMPSAR